MEEPSRIGVAGPAGKVSALVWAGAGERVPVVLLHPNNTAATVWGGLAPLLGRPVAAVDYRGHGHSDPGPRYLPADYAADALAVIQHLGWSRFHLVGGSIGGAVAVELAAYSRDKVVSIAGIGASLKSRNLGGDFEPVAQQLREIGLDGWFGEHGSESLGPRAAAKVVDYLIGVSRGRDIDTVIAVTRATSTQADARPAAAKLTPNLPALVAYGTHDTTCPQPVAEELSSYLGTTPVLMEDVGHLPMLEAPDLVAELLNEFQARAELSHS